MKIGDEAIKYEDMNIDYTDSLVLYIIRIRISVKSYRNYAIPGRRKYGVNGTRGS